MGDTATLIRDYYAAFNAKDVDGFLALLVQDVVHVGARARALENQICVAVAPTVGNADWSPAVDVNTGWAAAYRTPDRGFPDDGILAKGALDEPGWVTAELDFETLKRARDQAQVFTARDWDAQALPGLSVGQVSLT